jgi:hypothetical protein
MGKRRMLTRFYVRSRRHILNLFERCADKAIEFDQKIDVEVLLYKLMIVGSFSMAAGLLGRFDFLQTFGVSAFTISGFFYALHRLTTETPHDV